MAEVLVVDDDPDIRAMMTEALGCAGHDVFSAGNGREGVDQALATQPDLIVVDLFMPEQEGLETIRRLRQQIPQLPILAISGRSVHSSPMLTIALKLGAVNVLEKPFDALMFRAAVEATLDTLADCKPLEIPAEQGAAPVPIPIPPESNPQPILQPETAPRFSGGPSFTAALQQRMEWLASAFAKLWRGKMRDEGR